MQPAAGDKQTPFTRVAALAWAGLSILLALQWSMDLGMVGFPDGYITPFAKATSSLLGVLTAACMAQGLYFLFAVFFRKRMSAISLGLQILIAAILTVAPVVVVKGCPHSQACSAAYEALTGTMMDDGAGG